LKEVSKKIHSIIYLFFELVRKGFNPASSLCDTLLGFFCFVAVGNPLCTTVEKLKTIGHINYRSAITETSQIML